MKTSWTFGTDGMRGLYGQGVFVPERLAQLGWTLGQWMRHHQYQNHPDGSLTVVMGMDTRYSSPIVAQALFSGLDKAGIRVHFLGCCPTACVSFATDYLRAGLGLMISASHNPAPDNGIKFFSASGAKWSVDVEAAFNILASTLTLPDAVPTKALPDPWQEPVDIFQAMLLRTAPPLVKPLRLVVDAAHGAYSNLAIKVLEAWGAIVVSTLGNHPDGRNINDQCGAVYPKALSQAVVQWEADAGIAFDGDGDRVVIVNHRGECQNGDQLLAALSTVLGQGEQRGSALQGGQGLASLGGAVPEAQGVVGTIMTNSALEPFLAQRSLRLDRTHVGDRWIQQRLEQLGWSLGGESSGHIMMTPALRTGDGLLAGMAVLSVMSRHPHLFPCFTPYPTVTRTVPVHHLLYPCSQAFQDYCAQVQADLPPHHRLIIRPSGTEPVIRVSVEGPSMEHLHAMADKMVVHICQQQETYA